ncbi:LuxR C-terminal-related transcriptional regulator [Nocardioides sp. GY 10127]|uniref:helix-turn-helix transcriptional regulator n=1 Tax=Nocardioides sp. GY 10127 TaxID=2569762 RepID=UPI001458F486|nr:LuxR C-terminal-related transcriptional regulator [Nocardioides sp. GY 10127]
METQVAHRPRGGPDLAAVVVRPRLEHAVDALLDGTPGGPRAALVSAPPGFGKTTLASAWAHRAGQRGWDTATCRLTRSDVSPRLFWRTLLDTLRAAGPETAAALEGLTAPDRVGDVHHLLDLLDRLAGTPRPLLLVLDDVHLLHGRSVVDDVDELVRRSPASLRLALVGRPVASPDTALDLRLSGAFLTLGAEDLAFTAAEARRACPDLDPAVLSAVLDRTEGWPALTRLVAAAVGEGSVLGGTWPQQRALFEEVMLETLRRHPDEDLPVLFAAASAEQVPLELLVHLTGRGDAGEVMERAAATTGLVTREGSDPLPSYRLHAGLRAYLEGEHARRDLPGVRALAAAAARWHLVRSQGLEAVAQAVRSASEPLLAEVLSLVGPRIVNEGAAEELLGLLTPEDAHPGEGVHLPGCPGDGSGCAAAWIDAVVARALLDTGRVQEARAVLRPLPAEADEDLRLVREAVDLDLARLRGRRVEEAPEAAATLDPDVELQHALARGAVLLRQGRLEEGEAVVVEAMTLAQGLHRCAAALGLMTMHAVAGAARSDAALTARRAAAGLEVARARGWSDNARAGHLHLLAGWAARVQLRDVEARHHAQLALQLVGPADDPSARVSTWALAAATRLEGHEGTAEDADRLHRVWESMDDQSVSAEAVVYIAMADVQVCLAQQRPERLREVLDVMRRRLDGARGPASEVGDLGEVLVATAALELLRSRRAAAVERLSAVTDGRARCVSRSTRLEAAVLLARLHLQAGDRFRAVSRCRDALALAEGLSMPRPLLELGGPDVVGLLREESGAWGPWQPFVDELLPLAVRDAGPAVPLTHREVDVLRELATLRTVEEMGESLVLSVNTVKTHLRGVYRKLGVTSRRDAIVEARRAGLL